MTSTLIDTICQSLFSSGKELFLVFDRDGTLVPFTDNPADAIMDSEVRATLNRLAMMPGIHVGVLSARSVKQLQIDLPDNVEMLAGNYGLEIEQPHGVCFCHPTAHAARPFFEKTKALIAKDLPEKFQSILEDHGLSLCLHWHKTPEDLRKEFHTIVSDIAKTVPELYFKTLTTSYEIWPDIEWDKGYGIAKMVELSELGADNIVPLFAGDSLVDEPAFAWVNEHAGASILVGKNRPTTLAKYTLESPSLLHGLINRIEQLAPSRMQNAAKKVSQ